MVKGAMPPIISTVLCKLQKGLYCYSSKVMVKGAMPPIINNGLPHFPGTEVTSGRFRHASTYRAAGDLTFTVNFKAPLLGILDLTLRSAQCWEGL